MLVLAWPNTLIIFECFYLLFYWCSEKRPVSPRQFPLLHAGSFSSRLTTPNPRTNSRSSTPNPSQPTSPTLRQQVSWIIFIFFGKLYHVASALLVHIPKYTSCNNGHNVLIPYKLYTYLTVIIIKGHYSPLIYITKKTHGSKLFLSF